MDKRLRTLSALVSVKIGAHEGFVAADEEDEQERDVEESQNIERQLQLAMQRTQQEESATQEDKPNASETPTDSTVLALRQEVANL